MKIIDLWIEDYNLLQDFKIELNEQLIVLIGQNGSGKSTLLEFIAKIFYDLYEHFVLSKGEKPKHNFKLVYELEHNNSIYKIRIVRSSTQNEYYAVSYFKDGIWKEKQSRAKIEEEFMNGYKDMLPKNVVMYYSGISKNLENRFKNFQEENIIKKSLDGSPIEKPFFYFLTENFSAILIGLLSYEFNVPEVLKKQFNISGFERIDITIKKPYWANSKLKIDGNWGLKGDLANFLNKMIGGYAITVFDDSLEKLAFSIESQKRLYDLMHFYGEEKKLFEYITTLQANGLIDNIEILINKDEKIISHNNLSEGEKQLLVILGLKELLATENTLFLLDEPDTYLHPKWQRDFISELLKGGQNNQFIMTTHSPLILGYLKKESLKIIKKGKIDEDIHYSYGRDINSILLDLMGVVKRPKEIEEKITQLFSDLENEKVEEAKILLNELKEYFGEDDNIIIEAKTILSFLE